MATPTTPAYLPVLSRGGHRSPEHGACLMEYVSLLAGERFSDRPGCTDPLLAAIARQVNDRISDSERHRLGILAPALASVRRIDPRGVVDLAVLCTQAALRLEPKDAVLRRMARHAARRADRLSTGPAAADWRVWLGNVATGMNVLIMGATNRFALTVMAEPDRDGLLFDLLARCVHTASRPERPQQTRAAVHPMSAGGPP